MNPNLLREMKECETAAIDSFSAALKTITPAAKELIIDKSATCGAMVKFKRILSDYSQGRVMKARASGAFTPVPRKPVTVGLHWLLPKPFGDSGGDFRQAAAQDPNNIIYTPANKRSEVDRRDVMEERDWRGKISPEAASSGLTYAPGS